MVFKKSELPCIVFCALSVILNFFNVLSYGSHLGFDFFFLVWYCVYVTFLQFEYPFVFVSQTKKVLEIKNLLRLILKSID